MKSRVLVVDDEEGPRTALVLLLSTMGYEVEEAADGKEAIDEAEVFRPAVVIADMVMPGMDGLGVLKAVHADLPGTVVILLTGHASVETAVVAMKEGAYDYLTKPVEPRRLRALLDKAIEKAEVVQEVTVLRRQLQELRGLGPLLGTSPPMRDVYRVIDQAAATSAPVLIMGETGTGKELVARTIHDLSTRAKQPFVAVNCSAIPETLLESELFGHEKGAFTGAVERRAGYFELADGGTIFLDEITEMSPALQAKYLRTLQDGMVRRLGGRAELKVDVRVIAATNREPLQAIKGGTFREDLYYRLNVLNVTMVPLRKRKEDIPLLVEAFMSEFNVKYDKALKSVDDASLRLLQQHDWPGNVRELRNVIERAVVQCDRDRLVAEFLPLERPGPIARAEVTADGAEAVVLPVGTKLDDAERELILRTLESTRRNKTRAAEVLGVSPKTLHNKLQRYAAEREARGE
jgi:DNA-binding NtrC family response regulator